MIKTIEIENVKGIGSGQHKKLFELDIIPNKPTLLIAPNGFGKSSFCCAFRCMNKERIKLDKNSCHKENADLKPVLKLKFRRPDHSEIDLKADENSNTISDYFDCFVISNQVKAKGVGQTFGGRTNISASLNIDPIVLIEKIPEKVDLGYSFTATKTNFGLAGKALPNLDAVFKLASLFNELCTEANITILERTNNQGVKARIDLFKERINNLPDTTTKTGFINHINQNELQFLRDTAYLSGIANILFGYDLNFQTDKEVESYLAALQLIDIYNVNKQAFKNFCKRVDYEAEKATYRRIFEDFNTTWIDFKPKEKSNSLVLEFPKAHLISNGQRDVLSFVAMLEKARKKLKKENCILIIDEVFDYLDDGNLVAVQYYVSEFIEEFKSAGKNLYPLILSHLDPLYFKGYVFGKKQKIRTHYLSKSDAAVSQHLIKVLKERNKSASIVKDDIEKYLLHFHTTRINRRQDFRNLSLRETWGELDHFDTYVFGEAQKYCADQAQFDPLAVCCAVRKRVEKLVFDGIADPGHKNTFINGITNGTKYKLEFAEQIGIEVNETFSFLGLIYNEALHWKDDRDDNANISPAMGKLQNLTIKKLIKSIFA
jgi:hypothetical protein